MKSNTSVANGHPSAGEPGNRTRMQIQSLGRGLEVLRALAEGEMSVTDVGDRLSIDKSTAYRLLATLESHGFVSQNDRNRKYQLGLGCLRLAGSVLHQLSVRDVARPYLQKLADKTGETVYFSLVEHNRVIYVDRIQSPSPLAVTSEVGVTAPLHATASAKAVAAWLPPEWLRRAVEQGPPLHPFTMRTITHLEILMVHLQEVRERGFAVDDEEFCDGLRCVASPIFNHQCVVVGSLGASGPTQRMTRERIPLMGLLVRELAWELSRELGYVEHTGQ